MCMDDYVLETIVRARLEELRAAAERAQRAGVTSPTPSQRWSALGDTLRRLRGRLRPRAAVVSPSAREA